MKILQVIPSFALGGAETMCENLLYALRAQGHEVAAVSLFDSRTPITERLLDAKIKIHFMGKRPGPDLTMRKKLKKLFSAERPDVVHVHLNAVKYAAPAAHAAKIKKCVYTVHNLAQKDAAGIAQKMNARYFSKKMAFPAALSPIVRDSVAELYGLDGADIPVIYNGIDLSRCLPKQTYRERDGIELLHVGRFMPQKNHAELIRAFAAVKAKHPHARLRLIGEGGLRDECRALASELSLSESVIFEGAQANVFPYLQNADVFLLPSLYEGVPITLIEAMGSGLPIVASAVGGVVDMLKDGESALFCSPDAESIAARCCELIESLEKRESLGKAALDASKSFSSELMAKKYVELYSRP